MGKLPGQRQAEAASRVVDAVTREADGREQPHPVFCLMRASLMDSLVAFMAGGQRRIDRWTGQHRCANVRFEDDRAFFNANTPEDLRA